MMNKTRRVAAVVAAAAATLVIAATALSQTSDPAKQVTLDAVGAKAAAEEFVGEVLPDAKVSAAINGKFHKFYEVTSKKATVLVDANTGRPMAVVNKEAKRGHGKVIGKDDAAKRAIAYLRSHRITVPAGAPTVSLIDNGAAKSYEVTWQANSGQAIAPDTLMVKFDAATGEFVAFVDEERPYTEAPVPAIDQDAAAELARTAADMPDGQLAEATLRITFDATGRQTLTWMVVLRSGGENEVGAAAFVDVDAMSGNAVVTGRG